MTTKISWEGGNTGGIHSTVVFNEGDIKRVKRNVKTQGGRNIKVTPAPEVIKEPWQMTLDEFQQRATLLEKQRVGAKIPTALRQERYAVKGEWAEMTKGWHKQDIDKALREGKPVPAEVLKDYPDLAKAIPKAEAGMPEAKRKSGKDITSAFMNEVILYGGVPMTRIDVHRDALEQTGSEKVADMFAFSSQRRTTEQPAVSLEKAKEIFASSKPKTEKVRSKQQQGIERFYYENITLPGEKKGSVRAQQGVPMGAIQSKEHSRSRRAQLLDMGQSHKITINTESPLARRWMRDQGSADIRGIDTPRKKFLPLSSVPSNRNKLRQKHIKKGDFYLGGGKISRRPFSGGRAIKGRII